MVPVLHLPECTPQQLPTALQLYNEQYLAGLSLPLSTYLAAQESPQTGLLEEWQSGSSDDGPEIHLFNSYDFIRRHIEDYLVLKQDIVRATETGASTLRVAIDGGVSSDAIDMNEYVTLTDNFRSIVKETFRTSCRLLMTFTANHLTDCLGSTGKLLHFLEPYAPGLILDWPACRKTCAIDPEIPVMYFQDVLYAIQVSPVQEEELEALKTFLDFLRDRNWSGRLLLTPAALESPADMESIHSLISHLREFSAENILLKQEAEEKKRHRQEVIRKRKEDKQESAEKIFPF
jgi:hypothetical protein